MQVTVYGKPDCGGCTATKKALEAVEISFTYIDIPTATEEEFAAMPNYSSAPIVKVQRPGQLEEHWSGFRPDRIKALKEQ